MLLLLHRRLKSIFIRRLIPARRFRGKFSRFRPRCRTARRLLQAARHTREFMSATAARRQARRIVLTKTCITRSMAEAVLIVCESDFRQLIHGQPSRAFFSANYTTATKVFRSAAARIIYTACCRELRSIRAANNFEQLNDFAKSRIIFRDFFLRQASFLKMSVI